MWFAVVLIGIPARFAESFTVCTLYMYASAGDIRSNKEDKEALHLEHTGNIRIEPV